MSREDAIHLITQGLAGDKRVTIGDIANRIAEIAFDEVDKKFVKAAWRDEFAAVALQGLTTSRVTLRDMEDLADGTKAGKIIAAAAYALADAMLVEREKNKSDCK